MPAEAASLLWTPPQNNPTALGDFAEFLKQKTGFDWDGDYEALWRFSTEDCATFWSQLWDWHGLIGDKGEMALTNPDRMEGGQFFVDAQINYAENMLAEADDRTAIIAHREGDQDSRRQ